MDTAEMLSVLTTLSDPGADFKARTGIGREIRGHCQPLNPAVVIGKTVGRRALKHIEAPGRDSGGTQSVFQ
jgi:hypothetical protein